MNSGIGKPGTFTRTPTLQRPTLDGTSRRSSLIAPLAALALRGSHLEAAAFLTRLQPAILLQFHLLSDLAARSFVQDSGARDPA
jgi:hypothetical protein